jgi:hypothetical protein
MAECHAQLRAAFGCKHEYPVTAAWQPSVKGSRQGLFHRIVACADGSENCVGAPVRHRARRIATSQNMLDGSARAIISQRFLTMNSLVAWMTP